MQRKVLVKATYCCACESTGTAIAVTLKDRIIEDIVRDSFPNLILEDHPVQIEVSSAGAEAGTRAVTLSVLVKFEGYAPSPSLLKETDELKRALSDLFAHMPEIQIVPDCEFVNRPNTLEPGEFCEPQTV